MTMVPRPDADDSNIVESEVPSESTVPEAAPERRPTPVPAPPARPDRQRRSTVASPIPALLAASMRRDGKEGKPQSHPAWPRAEAVPLATVPAQTTSRLAEDEQCELLRDDDDPEYIVEIDASKPEG
jgi:hypothetical protein